ncbi:CFEM domain-containing protein [Purpureocillium lilacinum]|uniref:CFEM domain-containing protein n=1 Tax=Purpureocillium lilacinum TaxID=33203 RepID=A0A179GEZ4_PURLI|nr:CFEM domain-containing protein [Purpureocillium lilacinum]OAQ75941.1 CFEM domain-containing protein [Purpureocillium lilacinum]
MKAGYLLPVLLGFLGAVVAFEVGSLSGYIDEIPTCSLSAFARAMNQEGCDTSKVDGSDIECLCKHAGFIARDVARDVEAPCALDFGGAVGKACGVWIAWSSSATDFPRATSILGDKLRGKGSAATKTSDGSSAAASTTAAGDNSSSSDTVTNTPGQTTSPPAAGTATQSGVI